MRGGERAKFVEVWEAVVCKGTMEFGGNIQRLNIWGLRWRLMTSGQLDTERPCDLVKGCYSLEENGELMRGSGQGGEQGWVGGGDGVGRAPLVLSPPWSWVPRGGW